MRDRLPTPPSAEACPACALGRRAFLVQAAALAGGVAAALGLTTADLDAFDLRDARTLGASGSERLYGLPAADGATLDAANKVLLVRWRGLLYAFSSECPHKQSGLNWDRATGQFVCPKHKAHFAPDGRHLSGRDTRPMDRHPIRRTATGIAVDTSVTWRADTQAAQWAAAVARA